MFCIRTKKKSLILAGAMLFSAQLSLSAEIFRVHKTNVISLSSAEDKDSVTAGVNDAIAVLLPDDRTFVQGLEVTIKVPKVVAEWRDSVAWALYTGLGEIDEKQIDYEANRIQVGTFGSNLSLTLRIPSDKSTSIKKDAYSILIDQNALNSDKYVFLRLQLAMKGASDEINSSKFQVSAKPILNNKGRLEISAIPPKDMELENYTLFIDGKQTDTSRDIILDAGSHSLSLVSEFYRNELRTVDVEQAKTTEISIQFKDIKPLVRLIAPESTKVLFDDTEYTAPVEPFFTAPGEHTVKFKVGDYEVVKTISAVNGKTYNVSVNVEAQISEDD